MRMSDGEIIGFAMITIAVVVNFCETWWFGWNRFPVTVPEIIADTVCVTLGATGIIVTIVSRVMG